MNTKNQELAKEHNAQAVYDLAKLHSVDFEIIQKAILRGTTYQDFKSEVLSIVSKRRATERARFSEFSLTDYIFSKADNKPLSSENKSILSEYGRGDDVVPLSAFRTLSKTPDSSGGFTIDDELQSELILPLSPSTPVQQMASQVESKTPFTIPVKTNASTADWEPESWGTPTESSITFAEKKIAPFYLRTLSSFSKPLLQQSSIDIENFVRRDLREAISLSIEKAIFSSDGSSGKAPIGLTNNSDIKIINHPDGIINYDHLLEAEEMLLNSNAAIKGENQNLENIEGGEYNQISLAWVAGNRAKRILRQTPHWAGNSTPLWEIGDYDNQYLRIKRDGTPTRPRVIDYKAVNSVYAPTQSLFFGNWGDLVISKFSNVALTIDPYTLSTRGIIRVSAHVSVNFYWRHTSSIIHLRVV